MGGGIGGFSAGIAFCLAGFDVKIFEQSSSFTDVGAGIQISPNGSRILNIMGLTKKLSPTVFSPKAATMRFGKSGRQIFSLPFLHKNNSKHQHPRPTFQAPYWHIHRADLLEALHQRFLELGGETFLNHTFTHYKNHSAASSPTSNITQKLTAYFDISDQQHSPNPEQRTSGKPFNSHTVSADLLIGADGIHSTVLQQMLTPPPACYTGHTAWRLLIPTSAIPKNTIAPTATVWCGPKQHLVTYYVRGGDWVNVVAVTEQAQWPHESWLHKGKRSELIDAFSGWHPSITTLLNAAEDNDCFRWGLFDREPLPHWHDKNVVLLGDACHPMLPFMAQGATMAIEDAWCLASALASNPTNTPLALQLYETGRKPRTSRVQRLARANGQRFHRQHWLSQLFSYFPIWLAGRLAPSFLKQQLSWLYNYVPLDDNLDSNELLPNQTQIGPK